MMKIYSALILMFALGIATVSCSINELETDNKYNIKEPQGKVQQDIDVVIVPLVAFDGSLTRLGRGKGYYDRFLKETNAFKLGIAFSSQQAEKLPCSKLDVKLDAVITEKDIFTANGKNYI